MFRSSKGRFVDPPPVVPAGSATAMASAGLQSILDTYCPEWRAGVRRYITETPAEGMYESWGDLEHGGLAAGTYRFSEPYPRRDRKNFVESIQANPVALFRLIVESGAGASVVGEQDVVNALTAIASSGTPPPSALNTPAATWAFRFPARLESADQRLFWTLSGVPGVADLLASIVGQDLSGAAGQVLADARRDVVDQVLRVTVLFAARTVLARSPELPGDAGVAAALDEQKARVGQALVGELAILDQRVGQYNDLQLRHARALAGIEEDHRTARAADDVARATGGVDAVLSQEGPRPVRSSVRGVNTRRVPPAGFEA